MHWVRLIFVTMFKEAPSQPLRESLEASTQGCAVVNGVSRVVTSRH